MRFVKTREEEPTIGIAPLVDIVFLLLIFFMVTSHFDIASGVKISLPEVAQRMINGEDGNKITLVIDKSSETYLEGEKINLKELRHRLITLINEKGTLYLVLQADKDVSHGKVVEVMDLAKSVGVHSIIIAAKWKSNTLL